MSNSQFSNLEILSPAADLESLEFAVDYGANAVYIGLKGMNMRVKSRNFDLADLELAIGYAHSKQCKVYLTFNTLAPNEQIPEILEAIPQVAEMGVDAIIVADIGLLLAARRLAPNLQIHISTQMGIVNYLTASELFELGASRVVLARELSLSQISTIRAKTPRDLELEAFVHGSMCMAFSGRCLISKYLTGRAANEGFCAQPCRWEYTLTERKRPDKHFPIENVSDDILNNEGSYIMNAEDLNMINYLDDLAEAGVSSFKIEGRAKGLYYSALTTNAYVAALNSLPNKPADWIISETNAVSHRPYSTGFYLAENPPKQEEIRGGYVRETQILADCDGLGNFILRNKFSVGDEAEILIPKSLTPPQTVKISAIHNSSGEAFQTVTETLQKYQIEAISETCKKIDASAFPKSSILRTPSGCGNIK